MEVDIEFIERPRRTGKTTELKLNTFENLPYYKYLCCLSGYIRENHELYKYFKKHTIMHDTVIIKDIYAFRGISNTSILIIIDEPFMFSNEEQLDILEKVNYLSLRNKVKVIGIGTKPLLNNFEAFIRKDNK